MKVVTMMIVPVLAGLVFSGCDSDLFGDPPLVVTLRPGVLSRSVLQVNNTTTKKGFEVYVYVRNDDDSARSRNVVVPANSTKEFGALEINWEFKPGDRGFVAIAKHAKKLYFRIEQDCYTTWFGEDEIPEVDVASQIRARREHELVVRLREASNTNAEFGCNLYRAIIDANVKRRALSKGDVWPRGVGDIRSRVKDKLQSWKAKVSAKIGNDENISATKAADIADLTFSNSTDYFNALLDLSRIDADSWAPYVSITNDVAGKSVSLVALKHKMVADETRWSVIADYDEELANTVPVLVTANFPCEKLRSAWDGKEAANEVIALSEASDMKDGAMVVVQKNGNVSVIAAKDVTLARIYGGPFNTLTNGYNKAIRYLTPNGIVDAVGVNK